MEKKKLKGLTEQLHLIFSTKELLNSKLKHFGKVFCYNNNNNNHKWIFYRNQEFCVKKIEEQECISEN